MYSAFTLLKKYLNYYVRAANGKGHGTHSPFVYHFIRDVLNDNKHYPAYSSIEKIRKGLLQDQRMLSVDDYGAGSSSGQSTQRSIASIARHALKSKKYSQLLYRMIDYYKPKTIIELGTSLGITTAYLASAANATVITLEGANEVADVASTVFKKLSLENISVVKGNFDETLSRVVAEMQGIEFAFIDGNHREEPTVNYFEQLLVDASNNTLIILDDIHWSEGMEKAWDRCRKHERVTCSIDLFFIGIIILRKEILEKQEFTIRF